MKIKLSLIFFFASLFLFLGVEAFAAKAPYRPLCVGIDGRFRANSIWKGGAIQVGCVGDDGGAAPSPSQACTGEVQTVRPGQAFRLTKCSCLGSDKGCLKIGKELRLEPLVDGKRKITVVRRIQDMPAFINNNCRIIKSGEMCGSNGQHISGNVKITCEAAANTPTPTRNPSVTPTPGICPKPDTVTNVRVTCPNCFSSQEN